MVFESSSSNNNSNTNSMDIDATATGPAVILPEHHPTHHLSERQHQEQQEQQQEEEEEGDDADGDSLRIPIQSSSSHNNNNNNGKKEDLFIEIFPEEIAETSPSTLLQVLKDECADHPNTWADAALCYMQQGKSHARDALTILEHACELPSVTSNKSHHVRLLAATGIAHLSVAHLQQQQQQQDHGSSSKKGGGGGAAGGAANTAAGNSSTSNDPKNDLRTLADAKFTNAAKLDTFWPMTWIGRGMLNLEKLQIDQARFFFQTTEKQCGPVIPALLGMAAVLFSEGDYKGAQSKYEAAIRRYPRKSGAAARVGFGLCCYKLDQVDRAKAAFRRALDMDPENVEAMVSTALLDMASLDHHHQIQSGGGGGVGGGAADLSSARDFHARTEKAIKMMSMANLLDHSNAMVQNHLANRTYTLYIFLFLHSCVFVLVLPDWGDVVLKLHVCVYGLFLLLGF
jgi:Tetratricopeptide repeat